MMTSIQHCKVSFTFYLSDPKATLNKVFFKNNKRKVTLEVTEQYGEHYFNNFGSFSFIISPKRRF